MLKMKVKVKLKQYKTNEYIYMVSSKGPLNGSTRTNTLLIHSKKQKKSESGTTNNSQRSDWDTIKCPASPTWCRFAIHSHSNNMDRIKRDFEG